MRGICDDLEAETEALREVVKGLTEDEWRLPTPADGWDTHETVIHLGMADVAASLAVLDPAEFERTKERMLRGEGDLHSFDGVDVHSTTGAELWAWVEGARTRGPAAFRASASAPSRATKPQQKNLRLRIYYARDRSLV